MAVAKLWNETTQTWEPVNISGGGGSSAELDALRAQFFDPVDVVHLSIADIRSTPPTTIDGVTLAIGDRVLIVNPNQFSYNGIYIFNGSGQALTRAPDADAAGDFTLGKEILVKRGTINAGRKFHVAIGSGFVFGQSSLPIVSSRAQPVGAASGALSDNYPNPILADNAVTPQKTSGFAHARAYRVGDQGIGETVWTRVIYNTIPPNTDPGGRFNLSDGVYWVARAGLFLASASVLFHPRATWLNCAINICRNDLIDDPVNGVSNQVRFPIDQGGMGPGPSVSGVLWCNAGDFISCAVYLDADDGGGAVIQGVTGWGQSRNFLSVVQLPDWT